MYVYTYKYIAIICIHIAFLVSRVRYFPSISLYYPPAPPRSRCRFSRVFLFVPPSFPPANIPFVITGDKSRVIGTRSSRVITHLPFPTPPTYPVLQLALRSVLLSHFAFKVRLSLPNNIILSLDTSPCEGGRRLQRQRSTVSRSCRRVDPRREVFLFLLFLLFLLNPHFRLYSQLNMIFFFHGTDAIGRRINLINLSY